MTFSQAFAVVAAFLYLCLVLSDKVGLQSSNWVVAALVLAIVASVAAMVERQWPAGRGQAGSAAAWVSIASALGCIACIGYVGYVGLASVLG